MTNKPQSLAEVKEDIERRVAGFRRAYHKTVEEWRLCICCNDDHELDLVDVDRLGWVAHFNYDQQPQPPSLR